MLTLFADYGISLEAHVQNTLIRLDGGLPAGCLARDMEGTSVTRNAPFGRKWTEIIGESSPVFYEEEEAWMRLLYYNLTNHWSHMLAAVARSSGADERRLWMLTAETLCARALQGSDRLQGWIRCLLKREELPAKANLRSKFQGRGENPLYTAIPNPLRRKDGAL